MSIVWSCDFEDNLCVGKAGV